MSKNSDLLTWLEDHYPGKYEIGDLIRGPLHGVKSGPATAMCWHLQKLGVVTFKEKHIAGGSYLVDIQYRATKAQKLGRHTILFEMGMAESMAVSEPEPVDSRSKKLRAIAQELEDLGEITLAILVLDASEGKERDLALYAPPTAKRRPEYLPGSDRKIRQLSPEEVDAFRLLED